MLVVLFGAYLLFVIYGSLVPLHFNPIGIDAATRMFLAAMSAGLDYSNRSDWAANVLLFVPLTFLAMANFASAGRRTASVVVVLAAFGFSVAIEYLQTFFPPRQVSPSDIFAETTGGILGVLLWLAAGKRLTGWADAVVAPAAKANRFRPLLQLYVAGIFIYGLLPLDLTLSATEVFRKWRDGRVVLVPFSFDQGGIALTAYNVLSDLGMWIPVGFLWRLGTSTRSAAIIAGITAIAAALEFLKLFVESRITDSNHVVLAVLGGGVGLMLAHVFRQPGAPKDAAPARDSAFGLLWIALSVIWLGVLIQIFWFPFNASWDLPAAARRLREATTRVPFEVLFYQDYLHAFTDLLRRVLFFVPFGAFCGLIERTVARRWLPPAIARWVMISTAVAAPVVIEVGQLFLPQKTPDLTDTLLGIAGALGGYALVRRFRPTTVTGAAAHVAAAAAPSNGRAPRSAAALTLAGCAAHCALVWIATHASSVPYNLSKLTQTAFPIGSAVAIVAALYLTFGVPVLLLALTREPRPRSLLLPPVLLLSYGIVLWCLLRIAVPLPMIEKITGTPILGWRPELEDIGRMLSLASVVCIAMVTAAIVVASLFLRVDPNRYARVAWLGWSLVALPLAFHVVVTRAATDNLVELIADGAGVLASACLFAYVSIVALAGALLAILGRLQPRAKLVAWALVAMTPPVGYLFLSRGLEPTLLKYGQAFSALQFLLSADRSSYAGPRELLVRFLLAHVALVIVVAIAQWPFWRLIQGARASRTNGRSTARSSAAARTA
jgi:glycopeptide antibiotics resistance protein